MLSFLYPQTIDDETPAQVVLTWRVFYVPDDEETFLITDMEVFGMHVEVAGHKFPSTVQLFDVCGRTELERIGKPLLDMELVKESCQRDWDRTGHSLWGEMKGAA